MCISVEHRGYFWAFVVIYGCLLVFLAAWAACPEVYAPFLTEDLEAYCATIEGTHEWGGHLELRALVSHYSC
jgi:hypothetical protein